MSQGESKMKNRKRIMLLLPIVSVAMLFVSTADARNTGRHNTLTRKKAKTAQRRTSNRVLTKLKLRHYTKAKHLYPGLTRRERTKLQAVAGTIGGRRIELAVRSYQEDNSKRAKEDKNLRKRLSLGIQKKGSSVEFSFAGRLRHSLSAGIYLNGVNIYRELGDRSSRPANGMALAYKFSEALRDLGYHPSMTGLPNGAGRIVVPLKEVLRSKQGL
jgi:hypothetical protein